MKRLITILLLGGSLVTFPSLVAAAETTTGTVSFYSTRMDGHITANKERFNSNALTAAHRTYPFGTRIRLTNPKNNRSVIVRVNDRGPFVKGREISVTRAAAQKLGFIKAGTAEVNMEVLGTTAVANKK